jgi:3-hydroxyisobutyrate dehydrogenase-like beta-hydroxyacid dehydrogenase
MTEALEAARRSTDPKAVAILAKNIYREFRAGGFSERDVMALAGELLELVATDVRSERAREG